ncbi:MAG: S8 family serine peptidase [Pseudomonadota bacterium]
MRKSGSALLLCAAAVLSLGATGAQAQSVQRSAGEGTRLWFVELNGAPVVEGRSLLAAQSDKSSFRRSALAAGVRFTERRAYHHLFNGLAVEVSAADRAKLMRVPGVKALYPVETIQAPKTQKFNGGHAADLATAVAMTGADVAQNTLGLTGAGVKVAVMDTGIDIDHADLGGTGVPNGTPFPSARIVAGWDFVGDAYNADPDSPGYNPVPAPDARPDDCNGHGTHVAGIIGANGTVKGVAPGVTFGAYRVFGCDGSTSSDVMLAAMERAYADGMQVLNISIGSAFQWPQYPTAQAASRLVDKGLIVVASYGNSGASGLYAGSAPGVGKKVIGVAAYDNTHVTLSTFTVSPDNTAIGYAPATGSPLPPTSGSMPMGRTGTVASTADACAALPAGSLNGLVALVRRGGCTFHQKAVNVQAAGAAGMVLYNNAPGRISPTVAGATPITIPVVAISDTEGALIDGRLAGGPVTMTWTNQSGSFVNPTGGLISSFSSYGLAPDLSLKPNIGAPGGLIYSTYPLEEGGYATLSGTSMASPHVAGGVALLLQAKPTASPHLVKNLLQNAADPKNWWGNPGLGFLDNVHRQGAGMLDIPGAVQARAVIEPSELALGESHASGTHTRWLTVYNSGASATTYTVSHAPALATGPNSFAPSFFDSFADVSFSVGSLTVQPGKLGYVTVKITPPAGLADRGLYGGYVVLTPQDGGTPLRVPYAGFKGDYQGFPVLTPTVNGFPWLAKVNGDFLTNQPTGATYTMANGDIPYFLIHLDHQASRVKLEAFDAVTGRKWYHVSDDQYVPRSSTAAGFFSFTWDGTTFVGPVGSPKQVFTVPNGKYVVKVSVLKPLGDSDNPAHWETWTSPEITIARP